MNSPLRTTLRILIAGSMMAGAALAQAPGKALLDVQIADDTVRVEASLAGPIGGEAGIWGAILVGPSAQTAEPLPGLSILAEPSVLVSGPLDAEGRLTLLAGRPTGGGVYHLQAVVLHADLRISASAVSTVDLTSGSAGNEPPAVLERVRIAVEVMESQPPQFAIVAQFAAETDGYALIAHGLFKAEGRLVARFVLKVPGPGEGMLDIAQDLSARVPLGTASATDAAVEVAVVEEIRDGQDLDFYRLDPTRR